MRQILIFTDLDGTLLDHHTYSYEAARPALNQIRQLGIPLILSTSKTAAELKVLRCKLGNTHPFIVENGAAIFTPENYFTTPFTATGSDSEPQLTAHFFGNTYTGLIEIVHRLRSDRGYRFRGFADFSVEEVARETGLDSGSALLAKSREGSEPIRWDDSPEALARFADDLAQHQLQLLKGGRFYHILPEVDKGLSVSWLLDQYRQAAPDTDFFTIALGDGRNDLPMLEAVDLAVVLPAANGDQLDTLGVQTLMMSEAGPVGWNRALTDIISELNPKG